MGLTLLADPVCDHRLEVPAGARFADKSFRQNYETFSVESSNLAFDPEGQCSIEYVDNLIGCRSDRPFAALIQSLHRDAIGCVGVVLLSCRTKPLDSHG